MATASRKSLASRAGAAARKVVSRSASATAKKAPAKKAPAKKTVAKKAPAKKTVAKKAQAKTAAAKTPTRTPTRSPEKKTAKRTVKKTATKRAAAPGKLMVLETEEPWTKAELDGVRNQLTEDVQRLTGELVEVEGDLAGMIENSGEGAGNDQADVGSASFERDQEMVIVNNARDMLVQSQHALERIADGSYGQCEICGNAIGKNRLMAFPRATLCLSCKQREERR
jgi:RNA polymerase-binding transcription factor DksA